MDGVIISHAADFDGIASAALIMRKYGISSRNVVFVDYGRESIENGEKRFMKLFKNKGTLFITDLNAESTPDVFLRIVSYAKRKKGSVFWFDHHPWSEAHVNSIAKRCNVAIVGENEKFCASEITAMELSMNDGFVKALLHIVHISDFALTPDNTKMKSIIGSYVLGLSHFRIQGNSIYLKKIAQIAEHVSKGEILPKSLQQASARFSSLNDKRLKKMLSTIIKGGAVSVGFTPIVSTNDACNLIIKKTGSDIGCYVNMDNCKAHFRSIKSDCSLLAQKFGGGGHPHAAGCDFDKKKYNVNTRSGRKELADEIIRAAKAIY